MEQNLNELVAAKNAMVVQGQIVEATQKYFAEQAQTQDFDGTITSGKAEMVAKMEGFAGAIAQVKAIELKHVAVRGNASFAEYIFNFMMQDGSEVYWHEIIRSVWEDGLIVHEQYFKG